jgi:4'-phosphopantetheinyl transferase
LTRKPSIWTFPPAPLSLQPEEVHVWRLTLDGPVERFLELLQAEERARADRFHFAKDRNHFVIARGFLRLLLGRYLQTDPKQLQFSYGAWGKPALAGEFRESALRFNMSHSHGIALYALTEGRQIGVDVEYARADFASDDIARRFFSPYEAAILAEMHEDDRVDAFFRCWTRKEAYIKATGRGMSQPLDSFDVTFGPSQDAALIRNEDGAPERWTMIDVGVGPGCAGAVAVEGRVALIRYWDANERDSKPS